MCVYVVRPSRITFYREEIGKFQPRHGLCSVWFDAFAAPFRSPCHEKDVRLLFSSFFFIRFVVGDGKAPSHSDKLTEMPCFRVSKDDSSTIPERSRRYLSSVFTLDQTVDRKCVYLESILASTPTPSRL